MARLHQRPTPLARVPPAADRPGLVEPVRVQQRVQLVTGKNRDLAAATKPHRSPGPAARVLGHGARVTQRIARRDSRQPGGQTCHLRRVSAARERQHAHARAKPRRQLSFKCRKALICQSQPSQDFLVLI